MIQPNDVFNLLGQLMVIDDDKKDTYFPLCFSALSQVRAYLRPETINIDDIRITNAAAAIAYEKIIMQKLLNSDEFTSFKAGDITINNNTAPCTAVLRRYAADMKEQAFADLAELTKDSSFDFRVV